MDATPPRFTPLFTQVLLDLTIPAALLCSYVRLYAAAWRSSYRCTEPLDFELELAPLLGLRPSQAREHLRFLRLARLLDWRSDGSHRYTVYLNAAPDRSPPELAPVEAAPDSGPPGARIPESVVGGVNFNRFKENQPDHLQHQHTDSENPSAEMSAPAEAADDDPASDDPVVAEARQVLDWLVQAGVWQASAERLAQRLVAEQHGQGRAGFDAGDVLGWLAYCFADQEKNKIQQPAAVTTANLAAGRRCPAEYRPRRVCLDCGYVESDDGCACEDGPRYGYPDAMLGRALRDNPYDLRNDRWGICKYCGALPCQCGEA